MAAENTSSTWAGKSAPTDVAAAIIQAGAGGVLFRYEAARLKSEADEFYLSEDKDPSIVIPRKLAIDSGIQ